MTRRVYRCPHEWPPAQIDEVAAWSARDLWRYAMSHRRLVAREARAQLFKDHFLLIHRADAVRARLRRMLKRTAA